MLLRQFFTSPGGRGLTLIRAITLVLIVPKDEKTVRILCMYPHIQAHIYTYIHTYTYTRIHMHTYTYIHIQEFCVSWHVFSQLKNLYEVKVSCGHRVTVLHEDQLFREALLSRRSPNHKLPNNITFSNDFLLPRRLFYFGGK